MKTKQTNTLSTMAHSAVVSAFTKAFDAQENTGSHITQVCETAQRFLKGEDVSKADQQSIADEIASERRWKDKTLTARVSEVKVVLRAYVTLPEAIEAYKAKSKSCSWHDSLKLARCLNKHNGDIRKAVAMAIEKAKGSNAVKPEGRAAGALKAWYKVARGDKRAAILKAAALLHLELGV